MNATSPSKRRENLMISVAILKTARHGTRKTSLIRSVSLNYGQFTRYITLLKACGFIVEDDTVYETTEKRLTLIKEFETSPMIRSVLAV
jgi:predicted transcriptional regulator